MSFNLERFVDAQASVYAEVEAELKAGRKRTHWMWYIFPQIRGLGSSSMARQYAISGLAEAVAYLEHPLLGPRLCQCTELVNEIVAREPGTEIEQVLGYPDDLKFRSSMTLFARAAEELSDHPLLFAEALTLYFDGVPDAATLELL